MTNDKVHVGAGPGDPGLITVRGLANGGGHIGSANEG